MRKHMLWSGRKGTPLKDIERWIVAEDDENAAGMDGFKAYKAVAWVRRCIELRADALSGMPFEIQRNGRPVELPPALGNLTELLALAEMSMAVYGAEYWFRRKNALGGDLAYRHLSAKTITPKYDGVLGLTGFTRRLGGTESDLEIEDIVYLWERNFEGEIGPGVPLVDTALAAAGIGYNANEYAGAFFKNGAIPALLLQVDDDASDDELARLEGWWNRLLRGATKAWRSVAVRASVKPVVVGRGPGRALGMADLYMAVRQQIAVTFGVPQTLLEDAANYATAKEHRRSFYEETVIPRAQYIAAALNRQVFEPMGLRLVFKPGRLELFQQDEHTKAEAVVRLVEAGIATIAEARQQLGYESPGPGKAVPAGLSWVAWRDLGRWRKKATRRFAEGKPIDALEFDSDDIPAPIRGLVLMGLERSITAHDAAGVFAGLAYTGHAGHEHKRIRVIPDGADQPLRPIPNEITWTEAELAEYRADWDETMPELAGLLDAEVVDRIDYDDQPQQ